MIWGDSAPPEIKSSTWKTKSVAISVLLANYDLRDLLGWANSPSGSPYSVTSPGGDPPPRGPSQEPAPPVDGIRDHPPDERESLMRFETRPRASGFSHADALWMEAPGRVDRGWPAPPVPIDLDGPVATYAQ